MNTTTNTRGVSEAMVAELRDEATRQHGSNYADDLRDLLLRAAAALEAALSAEPAAQGEACGYRAKNNPDCFMGPAAVAAQKAMGWDVPADPEWVPVYTAPSAQPAERVPEAAAAAYAERIARALWRKHYADDAPQWEPLTGDLMGLLSQIDNMATGWTSASPAHSPARGDGEKSHG